MNIDLSKLTAEELTELGIQICKEKERRNIEHYTTLFEQFIHALNEMSTNYPDERACELDTDYTWAELAEAIWNVDMS